MLDVSQIAQQSGYLEVVCQQLTDHLEDLPGDARAKVGFIAYNSAVHFYSIADGFNQPHEITVVDIDDPFLPCPDNLLINLNECKELIKDLLSQLPKRFANSYDSNSALGAALQIAYKLMVFLNYGIFGQMMPLLIDFDFSINLVVESQFFKLVCQT